MRFSNTSRGRVHDPRVDVAELSQAEEVRGVLRVVEHVGGGRIDRHGAGVGGRVGYLSGVDGQGVGLQDIPHSSRYGKTLRPEPLQGVVRASAAGSRALTSRRYPRTCADDTVAPPPHRGRTGHDSTSTSPSTPAFQNPCVYRQGNKAMTSPREGCQATGPGCNASRIRRTRRRSFHSSRPAHGQQSLVRHLHRRRPAGGR